MGRLFGTDGVRGLANDKITARFATALAEAAATVLAQEVSGRRPRAIVGRDPRLSGDFLSAAVCAGLAGAGVDVTDVGVLPTPAVAFAVAETGADFGVMLSASHNAMPDNGIKFFAAGGHKLDDDIEDQIEAALDAPTELPVGAAVGRITTDNAAERYIDHVVGSSSVSLDGLTIVVDCAHGASSVVGPTILERCGATVIAIGNEPDGLNINDGCGSTHLEPLQKAVVDNGADFGVAFDGDADRCLAVDANGQEVDGDQIMGILALALKERGELTNNTLVTTVMSNIGLTLAMRDNDIECLQTAVGDRYVLEALREHQLSLGGEQSGHVVMPAYATTGDGVLTAVHLANRVASSTQSLAELASTIERFPQVLVNVKNVDKAKVDSSIVKQAVAEAESNLGETGRVLLRPSGTEPVIRVMVEAVTSDQAQSIADDLAQMVSTECAV